MWAVPEGVIFRLTTGVLFRSTTSPPWSGFRLALRRTPHSTGGGTAEKSRAAFLAKASPLETSRMAVIVAAAHAMFRNARLMLVMSVSRFVGPAPF